MTPGNFRNLVREEIRNFLETNHKPLAKLLGTVADALTPVLNEHIAKGILRQTGQLEPDERSKIAELLQDAADALRRKAGQSAKFDDDLDLLVSKLDLATNQLSVTVRPDARAEKGVEF